MPSRRLLGMLLLPIIARSLIISSPSASVERRRPLRKVAIDHSPDSDREPPESEDKGGFGSRCEYIWDCERPLQCCDLLVAKMCCGGDLGVPAFMPQLQPVPVTVRAESYSSPW